MSGSSLYDVQKAIYDTLTGDATLMAQVTGVFDFTPDNQAFPYVTIGEANDGVYATYDRFGQEVTETIHVWSRYLGYAEINSIVNDIVRLLGNKDQSEVPVDNWGNVGVFYESTTTIVEPDGITRHAMVQVTFKVLQDDP